MRDHIPGVWIIDAEARTLYASVAMAEILGTDVSAMLGSHSFDYLYPEDLQAAEQLFNDKQKGDPRPFHFRLKRADGSPVWVAVQGTPMNDAAGNFIGIVGTFSVAEDQHDTASETRDSAQGVSR